MLTTPAVKKGEAEGLLDHLNSVQPSIQLTLEVEKNGMLPFLDTLLRRKEDGSLDITVYRKPIHTDHYLDFQVLPSTPCQEESGQVPVRQGTKHRQHSGQPTKRRAPPF